MTKLLPVSEILGTIQPAMEQLVLTHAQVAQMIAHARAEAPLEACGLLGGRDGRVMRVYPTVNALHSRSRYLILPEDLLAALKGIEAQGWGPDPLAIYHSHPNGPETPSPTDIAESYYPDSIYIIVAHPGRSNPSLRGFRIVDGVVSEVALVVPGNGRAIHLGAQLPVDGGV